MDGEDAHRVVVGFGQHGLDDPGTLCALEVGPAQEVAQATTGPAWPGAEPLTSEKARAWSMTKRTRRHRSRGRPCANATSSTRRSRTMRSSSSLGPSHSRASCQAASARIASPTGWSGGSDSGSGAW